MTNEAAPPTSTPRPQLVRAAADAPRRAGASRLAIWAAPVLRVPLVTKLVGANVLIVMVAVLVAVAAGWRPGSVAELLAWGAVAASALVVTIGLVLLALRPIDELEKTARRVWEGDLEARVPKSILADPHMARIGCTFNLLLDGLTSDRARMRELASTVIRAGDTERARVAMELHDSAAQSLASISWQLGALARDAAGTEWEQRIGSVKTLSEEVLEEVRLLAQTMHPRILDDLGLASALRQLAREAREASGIEVLAETDASALVGLDTAAASTLYRVAEDAVANAVRHAAPTMVTVRLAKTADAVVVEIIDDGRGFDVAAAERRHQSMGLFTMRERIALAGGELEVTSVLNGGTRVRARIPNLQAQKGAAHAK